IPPHHGETNARIVVHLPLVVPEGCRYRVGFDECEWEVGKILAFDDTLEHEARNDSDQLRVVIRRRRARNLRSRHRLRADDGREAFPRYRVGFASPPIR
ncbi:MAG: aspartyl/asparaginyl beta-hydroxylase domain-containing protein, partial [Gammaproteobacteria bacterium]|nr:aspartyl/asparaginyl beta-hydroxylase domain-containing protein [Gammaproteobacteria bacterium]